MNKLTHKLKHGHNNPITDATVFSKTYHISFEKPVVKSNIEKLVIRIIQDIGRPLAHNGPEFPIFRWKSKKIFLEIGRK